MVTDNEALALDTEILNFLETAYGTSQTRRRTKYLDGLRCPACEMPEGWTHLNQPMFINCPRGDECGLRTRVSDLLPELLKRRAAEAGYAGAKTLSEMMRNVEKLYPPTVENPDRPAEKYMELRGIDLQLVRNLGMEYHYDRDIRSLGRGGVMFQVTPGREGVRTGRIFNPAPGQKKGHTTGPSGRTPLYLPRWNRRDPSRPIYVVEGVFSGLSLVTIGHQAMVVHGADADPVSILSAEPSNDCKYIAAFDGDVAGRRATKRWVRYLESQDKAGSITLPDGTHAARPAILPPEGKDWNDLLVDKGIDRFRDWFNGNLGPMAAEAGLALVDTPDEFALAYDAIHGYPPRLFPFNNQTYTALEEMVGQGQGHPRQRVIRTVRAANFVHEVAYILRKTPARNEPECSYHLKATRNDGHVFTFNARASNLKDDRAAKEFFMTRESLNWCGGKSATESLRQKIAEAKAPRVRPLDRIGWDKQAGIHVMPTYAAGRAGLFLADNRGLIALGDGDDIVEPADDEFGVEPKQVIPHVPPVALYQDVVRAWGNNGRIATAFMFTSWMSRFIKPRLGKFPFLVVYGDPGSGKTYLLLTLNNLQGRNSEGLTISSASTLKGDLRSLSQLSGITAHLLEPKKGEEGVARRGLNDLDQFKAFYNTDNLYVMAKKTGDNQTNSITSECALVIAANDNPMLSRPMRERTIDLHFSKDTVLPPDMPREPKVPVGPDPSLKQINPQLYQIKVDRCQEEMKAYNEAYEQWEVDMARYNARMAAYEIQVEAFERIMGLPPKVKATFMQTLLQDLPTEEEYFGAYQVAMDDLSSRSVRIDPRLIENYAIVLAGHRLLVGRLKLCQADHDLLPVMVTMLRDKLVSVASRSADVASLLIDEILSRAIRHEGVLLGQYYIEKNVDGRHCLCLKIADLPKDLIDKYGRLADITKALNNHPSVYLPSKVIKCKLQGDNGLKTHRLLCLDLEKLRREVNETADPRDPEDGDPGCEGGSGGGGGPVADDVPGADEAFSDYDEADSAMAAQPATPSTTGTPASGQDPFDGLLHQVNEQAQRERDNRHATDAIRAMAIPRSVRVNTGGRVPPPPRPVEGR